MLQNANTCKMSILITIHMIQCRKRPTETDTKTSLNKLITACTTVVRIPSDELTEREREGIDNITLVLQHNRLRCYGHVLWNEDNNWVKKCMEHEVAGSRPTHPFNGPYSGTTRVSQYQKVKTNLDFTEARDNEWKWHQLGHMQVCTSLQTDNHASTPPLS